MEVTGLDYEKVWYKVVGQVIMVQSCAKLLWYKVLGPSYLPLESKTMVSKTLLLELYKKIMNKRIFI